MSCPPLLPCGRQPGRRRARGLTLIEMVVVIGLVGVLASLAVSAYGKWRDKVNTQTAQADIIAISTAIDTMYADTGAFPANLAAVGFGGKKDPWGTAYVYVDLTLSTNNGKARKDHSLVPLNTDYDLYSKGPDKGSASPLTASSSRDDILRANNGRFVGPASQY